MFAFKDDPNRVPSIQDRFWDRSKVSSYIRAVAIDVGDYAWKDLGVLLTITEAYRTEEENKAVGGVPGSQHLIVPGGKCYAVDFRSNDISYENIAKIKDYVREMWQEPLKAFMLFEPKAKRGAHLHLHVRREEWIK